MISRRWAVWKATFLKSSAPLPEALSEIVRLARAGCGDEGMIYGGAGKALPQIRVYSRGFAGKFVFDLFGEEEERARRGFGFCPSLNSQKGPLSI